MRKVRICIAQINYHSANIQKHVERIKSIIQDKKESDLIVFPELILHGHPSFEKPEGFLYRRMKIVYSSVSEELYRFIKQIKARVVIGEVKRRGDLYYNVATYIDRHTIQSYAKTHVHWTENFVPGKKLQTFTWPFGKLGISICFDAAFSEVWRVSALKGAEVLVNISAVPASFPSEYMWLRCRGAALNNQAFVVYANRPGLLFSGKSAVFSPRGEVVTSAGTRETLIDAAIDLAEVRTWRRTEKILPNRRAHLYRDITTRQKAHEP
ncbi:MAG: carbon-nitrogen hydrolase family protein [Deltaproteobacteria bacterium]|nr:carbon-nitrogen hydrolase family protein [Deltaproteobacteria bacterium]